jgi:NAD(P)-dependent dehydrogenase (short-subunit alcohol dehydrogenase family)
MTNGLRIELSRQGTLVVGVHAGLIDTDMAAAAEGPKLTAEEVVAQALDAVEAGRREVLADPRTRAVKAALSNDVETLYRLPLGSRSSWSRDFVTWVTAESGGRRMVVVGR